MLALDSWRCGLRSRLGTSARNADEDGQASQLSPPHMRFPDIAMWIPVKFDRWIVWPR